MTVGGVGSHSLRLIESGRNIDQLNPSYFSLGLALTKKVANPFYGNGGAGTIGTATARPAHCGSVSGEPISLGQGRSRGNLCCCTICSGAFFRGDIAMANAYSND